MIEWWVQDQQNGSIHFFCRYILWYLSALDSRQCTAKNMKHIVVKTSPEEHNISGHGKVPLWMDDYNTILGEGEIRVTLPTITIRYLEKPNINERI